MTGYRRDITGHNDKTITPTLNIGLFAGPGGWCEGLTKLGIRQVGIEWDHAACMTAMAAGHPRILADVSTYPTGHLRGKVNGLTISAPCTTLSTAGHGAGKHLIELLANAIRTTLAGSNVVAMTRREATTILRPLAPWKTKIKGKIVSNTRAQRSEWARRQAFISCLILEIPRWIRDTNPVWFACEQVPAAMPLWKVLAFELRRFGYSTFATVLCAADYGVPQTRYRAILGGNRELAITPPTPTHSPHGSDDLFGGLEKHVSMAHALGWGMTGRPVPTVTAGGTDTGGAEPIARGGRAAIERERERERTLARSGSGRGGAAA